MLSQRINSLNNFKLKSHAQVETHKSKNWFGAGFSLSFFGDVKSHFCFNITNRNIFYPNCTWKSKLSFHSAEEKMLNMKMNIINPHVYLFEKNGFFDFSEFDSTKIRIRLNLVKLAEEERESEMSLKSFLSFKELSFFSVFSGKEFNVT